MSPVINVITGISQLSCNENTIFACPVSIPCYGYILEPHINVMTRHVQDPDLDISLSAKKKLIGIFFV